MAIKLSNIIVGGKRVRNESQLSFARHLVEILKSEGVDCTIKISRYYSDSWYTLESYAQRINNRM